MPESKLTAPILGKEDETRFWAKVKRTGDDECWLWTGSKNHLGYGRFKLAGKTYYAHRIAFALRWGDSPGRVIGHLCDNPACVNPAHLCKQVSQRIPLPPKPKKPRPDFPLWIHPSGRWCKKVRGRAHYFGKVADDPKGEAALELWNRDKEDLLAGRTPRAKVQGVTVEGVCDRFMAFKEQRLESGELAQRTWDVYHATCSRVLDFFGKHRAAADLVASDFEQLRAHLAKGRGPVWLANEIQRIRCVFRYAYEAGILDAPVRFGPGFVKPSAKVLRANRQKNGPRMFQPEEVRAALDKATVNAKGMILLALNCGLGNTDLGLLPIRAVDLCRGILDFPRSKTATERVVPLWPETVAALREVLKHRPEPADQADADRLFIRPRARDNYVGDRTGTRVHGEIRRALAKAKIEGRTAYDFRRTFQTVAEGALDLGAVQAIMGHAAAENDMSARYRQTVSMERKRAVVDYVRAWIFPRGTTGKTA